MERKQRLKLGNFDTIIVGGHDIANTVFYLLNKPLLNETGKYTKYSIVFSFPLKKKFTDFTR